MDSGVIVALIGAATGAVGGTTAWVRSRFRASETEHAARDVERKAAYEKAETRLQARIDQLESDVKHLKQALDAKDENIAELRSQRDRLQVSADVQNRFFEQLPLLRRRDPEGPA